MDAQLTSKEDELLYLTKRMCRRKQLMIRAPLSSERYTASVLKVKLGATRCYIRTAVSCYVYVMPLLHVTCGGFKHIRIMYLIFHMAFEATTY
jgi:hypothetical protein